MAKNIKAVLPASVDSKQMKKLDWLELDHVCSWAKYQLDILIEKKEKELSDIKNRKGSIC